jgi:hypothetical protein
MGDNDDDDFINEDNFIYDEIVHHRQTACRTNWRFRATALTQCDVALAASIQASLSFLLLFDASHDISTTPIKPMDSVTQQ